MTQTLDARQRISEAVPASAAATPATREETRFGTFAITFGAAFVILYTVCERMNWPLVTYYPAVNQLYFWRHTALPGDDLGPPMYWFGWIALVTPCAAVVGFLATKVSERVLQRATLFFCTLAVLWPIAYVATVVIVNRPSYEPEYLDLMAYAGIPALIGAAAATWFVPLESAKRAWTSWLVTLPIGALVILGYSLKTYFLR